MICQAAPPLAAAKCKPNEILSLVLRPGPVQDISIYNKAGQRLGWVPNNYRLFTIMRRGGEVTAKVVSIHREQRWHRIPWLSPRILRIELSFSRESAALHDNDYNAASAVDDVIIAARSLDREGADIDTLINIYQIAMRVLNQLHKTNQQAADFRTVPAPIDRLVELLVEQGREKEAYKACAEYAKYTDMWPSSDTKRTLQRYGGNYGSS